MILTQMTTLQSTVDHRMGGGRSSVCCLMSVRRCIIIIYKYWVGISPASAGMLVIQVFLDFFKLVFLNSILLGGLPFVGFFNFPALTVSK